MGTALLPGVLALVASLTIQDEPADRFADEPIRLRAEAPLSFTRSWDRARAESKRSGRRILAVFSGEHCGWCRVLETRTFTDAEVVELSEPFVCVELDTGAEANARVVDEYRVDTIPRSFVLTPDGQVVSKRTGYMPAAEYAAWLRATWTKSPLPTTVEELPPVAPRPVGAPLSETDVLIWSVDASRSIARWGDEDWIGHVQLVRLLRAAGLRPRVEHMARETFPARWDHAAAAGRVPELVVADNLAGLVRDLNRNGHLVPIVSERLTWTPENASCPDFFRRQAFLVAGSPRADAGRKAVTELLKPGPSIDLPGSVLSETEGRAEAEAAARHAVVAYLSGDATRLRAISSPASPQLSRCTEPEEFRRGLNVVVDSVEVRGRGAIAYARVGARWSAKQMIGADPVLVILRREASRWKAFAVSSDLQSLKELTAFCRLEIQVASGPVDLPTPRLVHPVDGGRIGVEGKSFEWVIPDDGEGIAAQICQVLLNQDKERSWPETRLKVDPGRPSGRALQWSETAKDLTGVTAQQMSWCVWLISRDGRISVSSVRGYLPPQFK